MTAAMQEVRERIQRITPLARFWLTLAERDDAADIEAILKALRKNQPTPADRIAAHRALERVEGRLKAARLAAKDAIDSLASIAGAAPASRGRRK